MNLLAVEKPARYMGGEMGSVRKDVADLRIALAFPDVYEVGMSHLGLRILYHILNSVDGLAAERVYAPWPDREEQMRASGELLATLETGTPLRDCQIVGFTLQYELSYTNIISMLKQAGIPLLAAERDETCPLVIAGGPCAGNPEPLAPFFDAILLGDGEEAILEIAETVRSWKLSGASRRELFELLESIEGIYIPSLFEPHYLPDGRVERIEAHGTRNRIRRRILPDLDSAPFPAESIVPFMKTVHDRVAVEIARGCTRGCRFCQAGYIYRPLRERSPDTILKLADEALRATGYDEISLLSLSTGDYSCVEPLLTELMRRHADDRVAISLPSLRVGTLTEGLIDEIRKVRKTGFTLAPEAGSERMRRVVNKGISETDLLETAYNVFRAGWRTIKLYFMIGLPGESEEDVRQIALLSRQVKDQSRRAGNPGDVTVSVSNFVPKSHTPFQWEPQISREEILEKQYLLHTELKQRKLKFKWHDAPLSFMEGVFARGDRRLAPVIVRAVERGCRFDGWGDHFRLDLWQQAFDDCSIDPAWYLRRRDHDEILPWDHLDFGVSREFLLREYEAAQQEAATPDCRHAACSSCGICDFRTVRNRLSSTPPASFSSQETLRAESAARMRLRFAKTGLMRYLSHLELLTVFTRAVSKAGVPVLFSQGFHPHPRFSFGTATSVGVESLAEYLDIFVEDIVSPDDIRVNLNAVLPDGLEILEALRVDLKAASLSTLFDTTRYRITFNETASEGLEEKCAQFMAHSQYIIERKKKGDTQRIDLRAETQSLTARGCTLELVAGRGKPLEFARAISGNELLQADDIRIEKLEVLFHPVDLQRHDT